MISSLTYASGKKELASLSKAMHKEAAYAGNEEWSWIFETDMKAVEKDIQGLSLLDVSCFDISSEKGLEEAEKLRKKFQDVYLMVIADDTMSPMTYVKPSVNPNSLLLRPYTKEGFETVIHNFISSFIGSRKTDNEEQYVIETREGKTFVPIGRIIYFEASQKKILIRVGAEEYETYDTMERLSEILPDYFLRTHRGYIVNRKEIDHIKMSENLIYMKDGSMIPISRSYRKDVRELWQVVNK